MKADRKPCSGFLLRQRGENRVFETKKFVERPNLERTAARSVPRAPSAVSETCPLSASFNVRKAGKEPIPSNQASANAPISHGQTVPWVVASVALYDSSFIYPGGSRVPEVPDYVGNQTRLALRSGSIGSLHRSVSIPIRRSPVETGRTPTSSERIRLTASWMGVSGAMVSTCFVMNFLGLFT